MSKLKTKRGSLITRLAILLLLVSAGVWAFPHVFDAVERSHFVEARFIFISVKKSLEECYAVKKDYSSCADLKVLNIDNPNDYRFRHFDYQITEADKNGFTLLAARNTSDWGDGSSTIAFTIENDRTSVRGTGVFFNAQQQEQQQQNNP